LTKMREPTEEEWRDAALRMEDAFHDVMVAQLRALQEQGFSPYNFRFCALGAHLMGMGRLIGAVLDKADRDLMYEYISGDGVAMMREVADNILKRIAEESARPN
jgi:hypothetical protein